jgi:hypothetical protein
MLAKDIPLAVQHLTDALDKQKSRPPATDKGASEQNVALYHRALPLIDLLNTAAATDEEVMWR